MRLKPDQIIIRNTLDTDRVLCAQIFSKAWNKAFPNKVREMSASRFVKETKGEHVVIAEFSGKTIGFLALWEPDGFIHHLYVDPEYMGRGVGTALVGYARSKTQRSELSLKCHTKNVSALNFYRVLGFTEGEEHGEDEYGPWVRLFQKK